VRDGTDANSAIFFGLGSSAAVFIGLCLLRRGGPRLESIY
jgi:hypothetical protein